MRRRSLGNEWGKSVDDSWLELDDYVWSKIFAKRNGECKVDENKWSVMQDAEGSEKNEGQNY